MASHSKTHTRDRLLNSLEWKHKELKRKKKEKKKKKRLFNREMGVQGWWVRGPELETSTINFPAKDLSCFDAIVMGPDSFPQGTASMTEDICRDDQREATVKSYRYTSNIRSFFCQCHRATDAFSSSKQ